MQVLIAVDEPGTASELTSYVCSQSWKPGTEFAILHVVQEVLIGTYVSVLPSSLIAEMSKEAISVGEEMVRDAALRLRDKFHSPKVKEVVLTGIPGALIAEYARENQSELIIMSSKKRGLERMLLGSVSGYVVAHSPCNVFVYCPPKSVPNRAARAAASAGV